MAHLNPTNPNSSYISVVSADMTAAQVAELNTADRAGANDQISLGLSPAITSDASPSRIFIGRNVVPNMPTRYK